MSSRTNLRKRKSSMEEVIGDYLGREKNWQPGDYRLEKRGMTPDHQCAVFWAIFLKDEKMPYPGGGKSLELHVDRNDYRIARELHFQ